MKKKLKADLGVYSICDDVLMYSKRVSGTFGTTKENPERISCRTSWYIQNEKLAEKLHILA